jgi:hypothetical protein
MTREKAIECVRQIFDNRADKGTGLTSDECDQLSKVIQYSGRHEGRYRELVEANLGPFFGEYVL